MGASSSRKVLCESRESQESRIDSQRKLGAVSSFDRLVRNELREKVQRGFYDERKVCHRVSQLQEPPKSIQQEDV